MLCFPVVTVKFFNCYTDVTGVTAHSRYGHSTTSMLQCYSVTAHLGNRILKYIMRILCLFFVTVMFFGRYTDVTRVTAHSRHALSTNPMLQCYSVTAHVYGKNRNIRYII